MRSHDGGNSIIITLNTNCSAEYLWTLQICVLTLYGTIAVTLRVDLKNISINSPT